MGKYIYETYAYLDAVKLQRTWQSMSPVEGTHITFSAGEPKFEVVQLGLHYEYYYYYYYYVYLVTLHGSLEKTIRGSGNSHFNMLLLDC